MYVCMYVRMYVCISSLFLFLLIFCVLSCVDIYVTIVGSSLKNATWLSLPCTRRRSSLRRAT